jgi:hypothetical protein
MNRYLLLTSRYDQLWFPAAIWALFVIMGMILRETHLHGLGVAFLGGVLPLMGGILAAYAILDDPALELRFATPRPAWQTLRERLGLILAVTAIAYQLFLSLVGGDLSDLGNLPARQLAWLVPSLAMMALGSAASFAFGQSTAGAMLPGLVWIFQVIARGWMETDAVARYFYLLMGSNAPQHACLRLNQASLLVTAALLLFIAWALFKKQERYL